MVIASRRVEASPAGFYTEIAGCAIAGALRDRQPIGIRAAAIGLICP